LKKLILVVIAVLTVALSAPVALAGTGNDAPTGPHFNLNIIGVDHAKDGMGVKEGGHVIFVELYSSIQGKVRIATDINLVADNTAPYEFMVTDGNGTDGVAEFQMPFDVADSYSVWVRGSGKPGDDIYANMKLCALDLTTLDPLDYICSTGYTIERPKGQRKFVDVSSQLLFIGSVPVFDPMYQDYFWSYQNNGLKLAQLRFYPNPAT